jgi:hypothetical protein
MAWSISARTRHAVGAQGHPAEQAGLVAQHREVNDRLTAVGEHHRQIHRDPARVMAGLPDPQWCERVAERGTQPGCIGKVSQQAGAGAPDDTPTISPGHSRRCDLGTVS